MAQLKHFFTLKILLSYLILGLLAGLVGWFLFSEIKTYSEEVNISGEKKFVETGTLINLLYKTDGFSRLALLTEDDDDFERYMSRNDSLFAKIEEIKELTTDDFQKKQLDSIKALLSEKNQNIEQLRILRLTNQKETSLDDIMKEVRKLEATVGLASVESMVREPWKLSPRERRIWQSYADYLNSSRERDTATVKSKEVDAMLIASRYIVAEAKKENSRIRESLVQKENELIRNDLDISERLRKIISSFDAEINKNIANYATTRANALDKTGQILKFAAVLGLMTVLLFSYFLLSDFFKAERYKRFLEESKKYSETLLRSREQLISTVSHDLNTPLNTISGYSELLEHTTLSEKQKNYLNQINTSTSFIHGLMQDLLDFSKLEAGKLKLEQLPFSLSHLISETMEAVSGIYRKDGVTNEISIAPEIESRFFRSDPLRIRQILNNLLSNAFKFTDAGKVSIHANVLDQNHQKQTIEITVTDTGIGISKERQHAIFEEFTQADESISGKFGGSGLGLAISKKLAELLDGALYVESEPGRGSAFFLKIPLSTVDEKPKKQDAVKNINPIRSVVIIDDDEGMRTMIAEILKRHKLKTLTFGSYEDFEREDQQKTLLYECIITDIQMPGTDGFSVLEKLKKKRIRSFHNQPVIAMTGSDEFSDIFFEEKGFVAVLRKPFSSAVLLDLLNAHFNYSIKHKPSSKPNAPINSNIFNLKMLYSFLESEKAVMAILKDLEQQTDEDLRTLADAAALQDFKRIQDTAHRMLTMYRQIAAIEVVPLLEKLEHSTENPEELVKVLREKISVLRNHFEHLYSSIS